MHKNSVLLKKTNNRIGTIEYPANQEVTPNFFSSIFIYVSDTNIDADVFFIGQILGIFHCAC